MSKTEAPRSPVQLAIGPANYAGQAFEWAEATRKHLGIHAESFAPSGRIVRFTSVGKFQFQVHRSLPHPRTPIFFNRRLRVNRILRNVTHLAVDGFLPPFGSMGRGDLAAELANLVHRHVRIALISHGSDTRDPDAHMARYPFSFYSTAPKEYVAWLRVTSKRNRMLALESGWPIFASTPDLILDLPGATWLPVTIDPARWFVDKPALKSTTPRVLHIPSRRNPPIKGSEIIEPILLELAQRGLIHYRRVAPSPHSVMPLLVKDADIVVDQLLTGSYGVAAVEAMAAGRLVVGFVGPEVRALMPDEPPIVNAPPSTFMETMMLILEDRERFSGISKLGPGYVSRWHSGRAAAEALMPFLAT